MQTLKYYLYDVFTDVALGGNPLAVIPEPKELSDELMQKIAREFNLSETTFIFPPKNRLNDFQVRIFTPQKEIPTAGHPTIGTAYCILNNLQYQPKKPGLMMFEEQVGDIPVFFDGAIGDIQQIGMKQPLPVFGEPISHKSLVANILSLDIPDIDERWPIQAVSCGNDFIYVPVTSLEAVEKVKVKTSLIEDSLDQLGGIGEFYVFSLETIEETSTTHGRVFAPRYGIYEDPATGSASGPLGSYLVHHGIHNGQKIICEQGFEMGRPSKVNVSIGHNEGNITEVNVSGQSVWVGEGTLRLG